jgi:hypothetical protein
MVIGNKPFIQITQQLMLARPAAATLDSDQ